MNIQEGVFHILNNYSTEKTMAFKQNDLAIFLRHGIIDIMSNDLPTLKDSQYLLRGSAGAGNWAEIPWICIFNKDITTSAQRGIYIVFLFSSDMEKVYLSFNQGVTFFRDNKLTNQIEGISQLIRELIPREYKQGEFIERIDLNAIGDLGANYQRANILSKVYTKEDFKSSHINIKKDIEAFLKMYDYIYSILPGKDIDGLYENLLKQIQGKTGEGPMPVKEEPDTKVAINPNTMITHINDYIHAKGFIFDQEDISNLYLSLKTKPFVLLAGISGTGKSKLVQLFAQAIGANRSNGRYRLISVKPDWNDGTDLFGYMDINNKYVPGLLTEIVYDANKEENLNKPYIICLDEMNLARVEYYLSDYLSIIESREKTKDGIKTDKIFSEGYFPEANKYSSIYFSDNINIVGTVNMDDTTFSFSEKVLDRANTIEFSKVDLAALDLITRESEPKLLDNSNFETSYLTIKEALLKDRSYVERINNRIIALNNILKEYNAHFGYRVRDEMVFYMLENNTYGILPEDTAFDYQVLQKILPKISGSDHEIKNMLIDLHNYLNIDAQIVDSIDYIETINVEGSRHPKSTKKIKDMLRSCANGYTSFW